MNATAAPADTRPARRSTQRGGARIRRRLALATLLAVILLVVLGPLISYKPRPFTGDGSPLRQIGYFAALFATIVAARPLLRPDRLLVLPISILIVFGWCWLSVTWAIEPDIAVRRLMLTTIFTWTIFALVRFLPEATTMTTLRWVLAIMLVVNFMVVIAVPSMGIHQAGDELDSSVTGAWRGLMIQKNFAGALCSFTILAYLFDARNVPGWLRIAVIAGAGFFLFHSQSKTSAGFLLVSILAGALYLRYNPAYRALLIPLAMIVVTTALVLAQVYWADIIAPLNDRSAFTGRTQIWPPLIAYARENLLTGSGYGSFWNIGFGEGPIFRYTKGWIVNYATQGHNGYLDLLVTIGLPGLILAVIALILWPIVRLLASRSIGKGHGALLLAILLFCAGHNLTESSLLDRDVIVEAFLILTLALIAKGTAGTAPRSIERARNG